TAQAGPARGAATAGTAEGQVMGKGAVREGDGGRGSSRDAAAATDSAGSAGTAGSADGLIPGEHAVVDRQATANGNDSTATGRGAYIGVLGRSRTRGEGAANGLVASQDRTQDSQSPMFAEDGATRPEAKGVNAVAALGSERLIAGENRVRDDHG